MRYPILFEKRAYGMETVDRKEVQYVAKFQIQRWKDNEERFLFTLDVVGAPTFSTGIAPDRCKKIKGLETFGRFAPLDRCPVVTGKPVNAEEMMLAVAAAHPHNALERERTAYRLRISSGVMKKIDEAIAVGGGRAIAGAYCLHLAQFWHHQAAMAEGYLKGNITDLTFYPVFARMKPQR